MTLVDRHSSCILAWRVAEEREEALLQAMVDDTPQARFYYSDLFATYRNLVYAPGIHTPMPDKSETYRVEGVNAELRHYLARLARKSRCFSRCIQALRRAVKLFVHLWNRRQLHRQRFPRYPAHLLQFVDSHP
jgi:insertion element IS1 protein InsB